MRIYANVGEAVRETERDLWEMGITVHPQTMQDKDVADDADFETREIRGYGFKIAGCAWTREAEEAVVRYLLPEEQHEAVLDYIPREHGDRISGVAMNPGNAWRARSSVWNEFLHNGKFAYTYAERFAPQLERVIEELHNRPDTRQAIINVHSNISPVRHLGVEIPVTSSDDLAHMGGSGRVPCSLHYQLLRREGELDLIYCMRSCDFLVHFPVDLMLAMRLQSWAADQLCVEVGTLTYFAGSLHAYAKEMRVRGIF
jgi:hypothetical protein